MVVTAASGLTLNKSKCLMKATRSLNHAGVSYILLYTKHHTPGEKPKWTGNPLCYSCNLLYITATTDFSQLRLEGKQPAVMLQNTGSVALFDLSKGFLFPPLLLLLQCPFCHDPGSLSFCQQRCSRSIPPLENQVHSPGQLSPQKMNIGYEIIAASKEQACLKEEESRHTEGLSYPPRLPTHTHTSLLSLAPWHQYIAPMISHPLSITTNQTQTLAPMVS